MSVLMSENKIYLFYKRTYFEFYSMGILKSKNYFKSFIFKYLAFSKVLIPYL